MNSGCLTLILDNAPDNAKGHFDRLTQDIIESFERNEKACVVVTQNSSMSRWFNSRIFSHVELRFVGALANESIFECLTLELNNQIQRNTKQFHFFILRSTRVQEADFDTLKLLFKTFDKVDLRVLTNVSGILSDTKEGKHEKEILNKFRELQADVTFFAWDQRVTGKSEFMDTHFLPEAKEMRERRYFPEETTIGFYGKLSSERGLFRLLVSVFLNPKLNYRIMGYGFKRNHLFRSRKFISIKRTPLAAVWSLIVNYFAVSAIKFKRVNFELKYFQDEDEMAREFQNCSAVFFSCAHSPYSSGLVYQSLAAGVPVVWSDGDSAMAYVLKREFPLGEIRNKEIFRLGGLTNFVSDIKNVKTRAIFENKDFDKVLMNCSCQEKWGFSDHRTFL